MTNIARNGHDIPYLYDRFGRSTRDGALEHVLDKNGNRLEIVYPGGVRALYSHDYADREATLSVAVPGEPVLPVVESASYLPMGPLGELELGNGLTETHRFDERYYPERITVAGGTALLDWQYSVDLEGNPTAITDLLDPLGNRSYGYQDFQYYLTLGNGPWGNLSWEYDRIGSRRRETRGGVSDVYSYVPNAVGGNTAKLDEIALGAGGARIYQFDAAGNQSQVTTGPDVVVLSHDAASQLAAIERPAAGVRAAMAYDGRGFLRHAEEQHPGQIFADGFETGGPSCWSGVVGGTSGGAACPLVPSVGPVYSSDGVLHYQLKEGALERYVLYFGGRPVLALAVPDGGAAEPQFLAVDHLGTPILASDVGGSAVWAGGFEPFEEDFSGAQAVGVYLHFPGQWMDESWEGSSPLEGIHYNLHRWYQGASGRYTRPDPLGATRPDRTALITSNHLYSYAASNPTYFIDPLGLKVTIENSDTAARYDQLKACFPLFRNIAGHFENDTWFPLGFDFGFERTWKIKDPDFNPPDGRVGGRNSERKTIWVPPGQTCRETMECLFHEFMELWLIRVGGYQQFGPAGAADTLTRQREGWIPLDQCCPCDAEEREEP